MSASTQISNPLDQAAYPVKNKALLTLAVMGATIIQILDSTIANVAIPHMQTSLGATMDTITWVLTSYIIASAVAMPITGWLSDRIGSRNLFLGAVAGFAFVLLTFWGIYLLSGLHRGAQPASSSAVVVASKIQGPANGGGR